MNPPMRMEANLAIKNIGNFGKMIKRILNRLPWRGGKQNIQWEKEKGVSVLEMPELLAGAVWEGIAIVLLVFVSLSMCSVFSISVRIGVRDGSRLLLIIMGTVFFRQVVVRGMLPRWRRMPAERLDFLMLLAKLGLVLVLFLSFFWYARTHLEGLKGGLLAIAQHYLDVYNRLFKANLVVAGGDEKWISKTLCFVILALFFEIYLLSGTHEGKELFLIFPGVSTALLMYVGLMPKWEHFLMAAVGFFMLCQNTSQKGTRKGRLWSLALFLGLFLMSGFLFGSRAEKLMTLSKSAKAFEAKLEKNLETGFSGFSLLNRVRVSNDSPRYKDAEVLSIHFDKKPTGNFYLLEFFGIRYENGRWTSGNQDFSDACQEHGMEAQEAARFLKESVYKHYEDAIARSGNGRGMLEPEKDPVKGLIRYKGLLGKDMLLPYGADLQEIKGLSFWEDAVAQKGLTKRKTEFQAWGTDVLDFWQVYDARNYVAMNRGVTEKVFWDWYDSYAADNYREVPESIAESERFQDILSMMEYEIDPILSGNVRRIRVAEVIGYYLIRSNYTYSWDLDRLDPGMDPVQYFLEVGHKGYCMHFASSAVLLLRGLGVPARYASGYVVKQVGFRSDDKGGFQAEVIDRNAHAWVEFYLDGIGWLPLEVTPGYSGISEELPTSKAAQAQRQKAAEASDAQKEKDSEQVTPTPKAVETQAPEDGGQQAEESQEEKSEESKTKESGTENDSDTKESKDSGKNADLSGDEAAGISEKGDEHNGKIKKIFGTLGKIMAVMAVLLAVILVILRLIWVQKERLAQMLRRRYYSGAIRFLNQWIYRRLRFRRKMQKKHAKGGAATDLDLQEALIGVLGEEKKALVMEYMRIVKEARFARGNLSVKEYKLVKKVYRQVIR